MSTATLDRPNVRRDRVISDAVHGEIVIPGDVTDLDSFLDWRHSDDIPAELKVHYLMGTVWVDPGMEELDTHNRIRTALALFLAPLVEDPDVGTFIGENMLLTNRNADLSVEPDGMVVLHERFRNGTMRRVPGKAPGSMAVELEGTPDIVIEVVSPGSKKKDLKTLLAGYHAAGIPEYWIINAWKDLELSIMKWSSANYVLQANNGGWTRSDVLQCDIRIQQRLNGAGIATYKFESR